MSCKVTSPILIAAAACCLAAAGPIGQAMAGPIIIGSLGNFDVYNKTGDSCDGFEVEMEGVDPSDVTSLYNPFGYNTSIDPIAGGTRVTYDGRTPGIVVPIDGLRHYGVHLRTTPSIIRYNWLKDSGGVLVHAPLADPAPVPLPTPRWTPSDVGITAGAHNGGDRPIWLKAAHAPFEDEIELEDMLVGNPLVDSLGDPEEIEPELLDPGDTLDEVEDILAATDASGRAVFYVYASTVAVDDSGNAVGHPTFEMTAGQQIGTVIAAVNFIPEASSVALAAIGGLLLLAGKGRRWVSSEGSRKRATE